MLVRSLTGLLLALPLIVLGCSSARPSASSGPASAPGTEAVALVVEGMACPDT